MLLGIRGADGLGAAVRAHGKVPKAAVGTVGPSPPEGVKVQSSFFGPVPLTTWIVQGVTLARAADAAPGLSIDPESLVPVALGVGSRHGMAVRAPWPVGRTGWGGMRMQATIYRNLPSSGAGPWKGEAVRPFGNAPGAAGRDMWSRPWSALPGGVVWRRDGRRGGVPRGLPPVRATMGGSPSGGERRVWSGRDLAHGGPDPGRPIQPWHADDVRPYDANPPWEPLGSVKAAHIAAGLVRLRVAHPPGQGPGVESVAVGLQDGRRVSLVVLSPGRQADDGRRTRWPGVRIVRVAKGTEVTLAIEAGVPFVLVVDGRQGPFTVPLGLAGLVHLRSMAPDPWLVPPESLWLRDRENGRRAVAAGLEALERARSAAAPARAAALARVSAMEKADAVLRLPPAAQMEAAAKMTAIEANAWRQKMTPANRAALEKENARAQKAEQARHKAEQVARGTKGRSLVLGPVPASGTDVELGLWVRGVGILIRERPEYTSLPCGGDLVQHVQLADKDVRRRFEEVGLWSYRTGDGVRAAAVHKPQPRGAWAAVRDARDAVAAGRIVATCVEDEG